MSSDIYATPDVSKKVRYKRNVQEDTVEWEERDVDIYESADAVGDHHTTFPTNREGPGSEEHPADNRRSLRAVAFCLGVLCFLMITGIIILSTYYITKNEQLQTRYEELHNNYSQLQERSSDMAVNNSQLQSSYQTLRTNDSQLQSSYQTLRTNDSQLQSSYQTLRTNYSQLQDEVKQLKEKIEGKRCPEGWKRSGCSCYFKSNVKKKWYQSRDDCRSKGGYLVSINNNEEQRFVIELNEHGDFWIGLEQRWTRWEWMDGSLLNETFWATGSAEQHQYVAYCDQHGKWTQSRYYVDSKKFICEKMISCIQ